MLTITYCFSCLLRQKDFAKVFEKCLKLVNEAQALVVMADMYFCTMTILCLQPLPLFGGEVVSLAFIFMSSLSGFPADLTIISKFSDDFYDIGTCTSRFNCSKFIILVSDRFSSSPAIS